MIWALGLIAPFLVFFALINLRKRARRRALPPIQVPREVHDTTQVAPPESARPIQQTSQTIASAKSVFDELRSAMEDDDVNLFAPLHVALASLVTVGRSLEVRAMFFVLFLLV